MPRHATKPAKRQTKGTHLGTGTDPLGGIVTGRAKLGPATRVGTTEPRLNSLVPCLYTEARAEPHRGSGGSNNKLRKSEDLGGQAGSLKTGTDADFDPKRQQLVASSVARSAVASPKRQRRVQLQPAPRCRANQQLETHQASQVDAQGGPLVSEECGQTRLKGDQPLKRQKRPGSTLYLQPRG